MFESVVIPTLSSGETWTRLASHLKSSEFHDEMFEDFWGHIMREKKRSTEIRVLAATETVETML